MTENLYNQQQLCAAVKRVTLGGLVINLFLAAFKLGAGVFGNSQAMIADAVHSLADSVTDVAIIFGVRFWSAPPDERHPYGHWRIETLITTAIGLVLIAVAVGISVGSLRDIQHGQGTAPSWVAFWAAVVSLISKELLYQWTVRTGRQLNSSAVVANAWDHRSDAMSSIPAGIAILT